MRNDDLGVRFKICMFSPHSVENWTAFDNSWSVNFYYLTVFSLVGCSGVVQDKSQIAFLCDMLVRVRHPV